MALGKKVVLVLVNGRPLSISWAAEHVPAILEAWEPGSEGGNAVADILFGDVNPGGKLPVTFPRKAAHAPLYYARVLTHQPEGSQRYQSRYWDGSGVAALSLRLRAELHHVRLLEPQGDRAEGPGGADRHRVRGREERRSRGRGRGRPALRPPALGQRLAPAARDEGLRARRPRPRRDEDGVVQARARGAPLLEHGAEEVHPGGRARSTSGWAAIRPRAPTRSSR